MSLCLCKAKIYCSVASASFLTVYRNSKQFLFWEPVPSEKTSFIKRTVPGNQDDVLMVDFVRWLLQVQFWMQESPCHIPVAFSILVCHRRKCTIWPLPLERHSNVYSHGPTSVIFLKARGSQISAFQLLWNYQSKKVLQDSKPEASLPQADVWHDGICSIPLEDWHLTTTALGPVADFLT